MLAGAVELTAWVLPGVAVTGGVVSHLVVALFIGLCNVLVPFVTGRLPQPASVVLLALLTPAATVALYFVAGRGTPPVMTKLIEGSRDVVR